MAQPRQRSSIHLRLLAASLFILPIFLGFTAWILDRAFGNYQLDSQRDNMRLQQLLLAKAADWDGAAWMFGVLDEPRLKLLDSGLYALVLSGSGDVLWRSPSAEQMGELDDPGLAVSTVARKLGLVDGQIGERIFAECDMGMAYFCQATRVAWGSDGPESVFLIVDSQARILAARSKYRGYLWALSLAAGLLLLLAQSLVFRWGLVPLRRIASALGQLERGETDRLEGRYPAELVPLTDNINVLLASERGRRERVRNTMDRLTHVLKTPLMLMRNSTDDDRQFRSMAQEQVGRMLGIVEGELARARLDGHTVDILGKPVEVRPVLQRIVDAYSRLPRPGVTGGDADQLLIDTDGISVDAVFHGEQRDLQDLFGSILENSLKYCRCKITVTAAMQAAAEGDSLLITLGDDGDGIPEGYDDEILRRGARADSANVGQGLGLAIVVEIVSAYGGSLHTERSELGGALFVVKLPTVLNCIEY